jgi:hypothetical protein
VFPRGRLLRQADEFFGKRNGPAHGHASIVLKNSPGVTGRIP